MFDHYSFILYSYFLLLLIVSLVSSFGLILVGLVQEPTRQMPSTAAAAV